MEKTMFPREFIEWKDKCTENESGFVDYIWYKEKHYNVLNKQRTKYTLMNLDKLYQYWRLEIEPKTKEDESK